MKKYKLAALILTGAILMSGCSLFEKEDVYALPDGAPAFEHIDIGEQSGIEFNGRQYAYFGTIKSKITDNSVKACIGYLNDDKNDRLFLLSEEMDDNYIMVKNTKGIMEQPGFYRAVDTRNKDIYTPEYIESLGYEYWGSSGLHYEMATASVAVSVEGGDVKTINYEIKINGEKGFDGTTGYLNGKNVRLGDPFIIEMNEQQIGKLIDKDQPFEATIKFTVTDSSGNEHEVTGEFTHSMMLGGYLFKLEIRYDDTNGYYLFENI